MNKIVILALLFTTLFALSQCRKHQHDMDFTYSVKGPQNAKGFLKSLNAEQFVKGAQKAKGFLNSLNFTELFQPVSMDEFLSQSDKTELFDIEYLKYLINSGQFHKLPKQFFFNETQLLQYIRIMKSNLDEQLAQNPKIRQQVARQAGVIKQFMTALNLTAIEDFELNFQAQFFGLIEELVFNASTLLKQAINSSDSYVAVYRGFEKIVKNLKIEIFDLIEDTLINTDNLLTDYKNALSPELRKVFERQERFWLFRLRNELQYKFGFNLILRQHADNLKTEVGKAIQRVVTSPTNVFIVQDVLSQLRSFLNPIQEPYQREKLFKQILANASNLLDSLPVGLVEEISTNLTKEGFKLIKEVKGEAMNLLSELENTESDMALSTANFLKIIGLKIADLVEKNAYKVEKMVKSVDDVVKKFLASQGIEGNLLTLSRRQFYDFKTKFYRMIGWHMGEDFMREDLFWAKKKAGSIPQLMSLYELYYHNPRFRRFFGI